MKRFRIVDNICGWLAFAIAAFVYCSTVEPTASFWDCPEFITTGYKLEVGHPPGAPFFMLTANLFSQFASDASQVALMVNMMSALLSATCILFLFWTITHLTRRLVVRDGSDIGTGKLIAIEAAGMVGALIYTFSDTFWFSAVEGEVYAYSSAFTAVVFWLILKWEDHADEPHSDRWLVLISYMTGLSIGVHLLNLLCIPAIVLVYYYKRYPNANLMGSLIALFLSFAIVAAVLYGVVPGIITVGGWFELLFVNDMHMPFNTGLIVYILLLVAVVVWAIYETYKDKSLLKQNIAFLAAVGLLGIPFYGYGWGAFITGIIVLAILTAIVFMKKGGAQLISARVKNTSLLCMLMLMIGYSTYAVIMIRSAANPPMDQNSPEDIFTLGTYLSRDQYGNRPLFYGEAYTSDVKPDATGTRPEMVIGAPVYEKKEKASPDEPDSYFIAGNKRDYEYVQKMFFPRMYDMAHANDYEAWMGGVEKRETSDGGKLPTAGENIRFFLSYQCNFMYWRYFMWNFAGRQNDIQGNGEPEHGNWITGIPFIDNMMLGDQDLLPDDLKANKGHNVFYCLPLLLGLIGLFWQAWRGKRGIQQFWVVFFLFFMTGLAIVFYLNQTPVQPRERDYAYAGSFYAFAIWCGMGVAGIWDMLRRKLAPAKKAKDSIEHEKDTSMDLIIAAVVGIVCLIVPIQMASQTWDDHDRSDRYTCRDFGQNYLMCLQQEGNPIIFTNGDNDTFPLWYNQDVEGVRTDARVCNLSYLNTDWYIDQMRRPAYDSPALPINWPRLDYVTGTNDAITVDPSYKKDVLEFCHTNPEEARKVFGDEKNPFELKNVMKYWVLSSDRDMRVIPTDTVFVTIDKEAVKKSGMLMAADTIPDRMVISLKGKSVLYKSDLMMLELIANSNWTRPIYVAITVGESNFMNLGDNFIQEGLVNRISPFNTRAEGARNFDTEKAYNNVMNRFKWGGLKKKGLYLDETVTRMCWTHRHLMTMLASELILEGKNDKAMKVLQKAETEIPEYNVPLTLKGGGFQLAHCYLALGKDKRAFQILDGLWKECSQYLKYYLSLSNNRFMLAQSECLTYMSYMNNILKLAEEANPKWCDSHAPALEGFAGMYQARGGSFGEE